MKYSKQRIKELKRIVNGLKEDLNTLRNDVEECSTNGNWFEAADSEIRADVLDSVIHMIEENVLWPAAKQF